MGSTKPIKRTVSIKRTVWKLRTTFLPYSQCTYLLSRIFHTHIVKRVLIQFPTMNTTVCHFMKCFFQRGVAECRHAAIPLSSCSINTTLQGFQMRYITLLYLKGLKSYQLSKFKCQHFTPLSLVNRTFHLHFCWYLLSPFRYIKVIYLFWKPWSVLLMLQELKCVAACLHSATPLWI